MYGPLDLTVTNEAYIDGLRPEMILAIMAVSGIFARYNERCTITNAAPGDRGLKSPGNDQWVVYIRMSLLPPDLVTSVLAVAKRALGKNYEVSYEGRQMRIEYKGV